MERFKQAMKSFDEWSTTHIVPHVKKTFIYLPFFAGAFIVVMVALYFFKSIHNKSDFTAAKMTHDISVIVQSLQKIDTDCDILSFDHQRNYIDFLTVKEFVGSEVGGLNLGRPENWSGPYLQDNPTIQGTLYEIIKTDEGIFVVPGSGVTLPSGDIIGKEIAFTPETSILSMIKKDGKLFYKGEALAAHLSFRVGDFSLRGIDSHDLKKVNDMVEEFNEAMSFTHNEDIDASMKRVMHKVELAKEM